MKIANQGKVKVGNPCLQRGSWATIQPSFLPTHHQNLLMITWKVKVKIANQWKVKVGNPCLQRGSSATIQPSFLPTRHQNIFRIPRVQEWKYCKSGNNEWKVKVKIANEPSKSEKWKLQIRSLVFLKMERNLVVRFCWRIKHKRDKEKVKGKKERKTKGGGPKENLLF